MFCTKCGSKLKENAKFCTKCGTPVKVRREARPQVKQEEQRTTDRGLAQGQGTTQSQEMDDAQKRREVQEMQEAQKRREAQAIHEARIQAEAQNIRPGTNASPENNDDNKKTNSNKKGLIIFLSVLIGILIIGIIITSIIIIKRKAEESAFDRDDTSIITESDMNSSDDQDDELPEEGSEIGSETNEADTEEASTEAQTNEVETQEETEPPTEPVILGDYTNNAEKINTYKIIISDNSWTEAYNEALEYENGYLVHINSQKEFDHIVNQIAAEGHESKIFWLGGMRTGNSSSYNWIDSMGSSTGPELNSQNFWMSDEPSFYDYDLDMDEKYMNTFFHTSSGQWVVNDAPNSLVSIIPSYSGKTGYIVEIEN